MSGTDLEGRRRLVRSPDRWVGGVLGGIADHYGWPVFRVRAAFTVLAAISAAFPGVLVYLLLWLVMPDGRRRQTKRFEVRRP